MIVPPRAVINHDGAFAAWPQYAVDLRENALGIRGLMDDSPAPDVVEAVRTKSHALGIHLQHGPWDVEELEPPRAHRGGRAGQIDAGERLAARGQQLCMGPLSDPDFEHILVA